MAPFAIWVMVQRRVAPGTFASTLRRFQRRLRISVFARSVPITGVCALAAVDVGCLVLRPTVSVAILACAGALVFTLLAAWLVALIRTPSLSATARVLDRRARLDDRAVTALQFAAAGDAVSRLIVEETRARLETTPVSRLPLDVSGPWRWGAVAVLAVSGLIVIGLDQPNAGSSSMQPAGPSSAAAPSTRATRANARQGSSSATRTGDERMAGAPEHPETTLTAAQKVKGGDDSAAVGDPRAGVGNTATQPGSATQDGEPLDRVGSASAPRTEAAATARGTSDGDRGGGGDASRADTAALSAAGRGGRGATRSATTGGGVAGGALARDGAAPKASASPANSVLGTSDFRRAYARAEAAIGRERVPPRLRSYVRDYFLAIRPQPTP
jgi:hypothetical protein